VPRTTRNRARSLRRTSTKAEAVLWNHLRHGQFLTLHFRRQHPIPPYIADFACVKANLVVDVDGPQHSDQPYDQRRTLDVEQRGWRVIRLRNEDVLSSIHDVLDAVAVAVGPAPLPSPASGGGSKQGDSA